jgi:hypothetical protein
MDPNNANVLYAGIVGQGVSVTTDGGNTWTVSNLPTGAPGIREVNLALATESSPETLYALVLTNTDRRILASDDGGANFELRSTNNLYRDTIGVDPLFSRRVYVSVDVGGSNTIFVSDDGGVTFPGTPWPPGVIGPHVDQHQFLTPSPGKIYTACDGGLFLSTDFGMSWSFLGTGLANVEFYDIADAATAPNEVIGGTQDNGTVVYDGSSTVWREFQGGDGATVAIDPTDANIVYAMNQFAPSMRRVDLSNNSGECIACGLVCTDAGRCQTLQFPGPSDHARHLARLVGILFVARGEPAVLGVPRRRPGIADRLVGDLDAGDGSDPPLGGRSQRRSLLRRVNRRPHLRRTERR